MSRTDILYDAAPGKTLGGAKPFQSSSPPLLRSGWLGEAASDNHPKRWIPPADRDQLARLREALWPETLATEHARELQPILAGETPGSMALVNFVAETAGGTLLGLAEVDLRSHADGCDPARPVGYLEGWYVAEEARHIGIGRRLLSAAEDWVRGHGCVEMASDTWIDHDLSQTCHEALGFEVVDRCVHYRKAL
jgi:aminoglycoside 6'-N-acetyltransferase I